MGARKSNEILLGIFEHSVAYVFLGEAMASKELRTCYLYYFVLRCYEGKVMKDRLFFSVRKPFWGRCSNSLLSIT